jgi:hypothetical protein
MPLRLRESKTASSPSPRPQPPACNATTRWRAGAVTRCGEQKSEIWGSVRNNRRLIPVCANLCVYVELEMQDDD